MERGIFETRNSKLPPEQTGVSRKNSNRHYIDSGSKFEMVNQNLARMRASRGSSARKSKAIDLDSIMMGIEEYLNDNESDEERKSNDDNNESDRNKDDKVDNDDDEATMSSRDFPANNLDNAQGKEDGNIDNRHSKHEGEERNISHLNSDAMQSLRDGLVGEIKNDRVDEETQASGEEQLLEGDGSKPFETADSPRVQQDTLSVEVGKTMRRDEVPDREYEDKLGEGSGQTKGVEEYERELEVTSNLNENDRQEEKTFLRVGSPVDQSKGIKEDQHPESSRTRVFEDIVGQAKDVEEGRQHEEVPTKAEQLEDVPKQTEIIDRHHEPTKDVEESNCRDKVVEAAAEPDKGTEGTEEFERVSMKGESAQNIEESVAHEDQKSVEAINGTINNARKEDEKSPVKLELSGDVTEQVNNVGDMTTEAGRMEDEVTAKCAEQKSGSEESLTKSTPVGDTVKQSKEDEHEKTIATEGLIEHELEDDSSNKTTRDVSKTAMDTERTEYAPPQSELVEEVEEEGERKGTSTKPAPIEHESEDGHDIEMSENASEAAKNNEEHAPSQSEFLEEKKGQSELIEEESKKEGGPEEASTEPASIEHESEHDSGNEIAESASETAKNNEEGEHASSQGEFLEEKKEQSELIEEESKKEGGPEEASTEPAPIEHESEHDSGNEIAESASETAKNNEEGEHASSQGEFLEEKKEQSELIEEESKKEGGPEEASTEPAPIEHKVGDDNDGEVAQDISQATKDTDKIERAPSQSELLEKDDKHGETSVKAGPIECESESVGDLEQSNRGDETSKATAESPQQAEADDGQEESITKVELGEYIAEPNKGEKVVDQTRPLESQNEGTKKEGEQYGESLAEQSKSVDANHQHDETTREVVSDKHDSYLAEDDKEGTGLKDKVAGDTAGLTEEIETHEEVSEVTKKATGENELQESTPRADSVKDVGETEVVNEGKARPEQAQRETEPVANTTLEEVKKENEASEKPATGVEIETAEKQTELARENTETKTSTSGAVEEAAQLTKNTQESITRVGSIEEAAASLESVKDGAEEGDKQTVHPVDDPSQDVDYSLEPIGVNSADADMDSARTTDSPNKIQDDEPIQADLPINSNSDKSSSISPLADAKNSEAAYSGTGIDDPNRVSTKAEQDTNRGIASTRFPVSPVAENSGSIEENKGENPVHNDPIGKKSEAQLNDHKSAQTNGEQVAKNIEAAENAENTSPTDSRKPEQPISSTSFDAETEAILRGLDNPQELLKELELERRSEPVYIFTSLAGGGFHIIPRTNRLATILQANRIEFTYRDLGTDPQARNLWKAHANGKQLPGLVRGSDVVGNWQDIDEANEEYRLDELLYNT